MHAMIAEIRIPIRMTMGMTTSDMIALQIVMIVKYSEKVVVSTPRNSETGLMK